MFIIYAALIFFVLCAVAPVIYDQFMSRRENTTWNRRLAAYGTMSFFVLGLPLLAGNLFIDCLFAIVAVSIAVMIADVTLFGILFILVLSTLAFPVYILFELARQSHMELTFKLFMDKVELQYMLMPLALGVITLIVARDQVKRWNWKRK